MPTLKCLSCNDWTGEAGHGWYPSVLNAHGNLMLTTDVVYERTGSLQQNLYIFKLSHKKTFFLKLNKNQSCLMNIERFDRLQGISFIWYSKY